MDDPFTPLSLTIVNISAAAAAPTSLLLAKSAKKRALEELIMADSKVLFSLHGLGQW